MTTPITAAERIGIDLGGTKIEGIALDGSRTRAAGSMAAGNAFLSGPALMDDRTAEGLFVNVIPVIGLCHEAGGRRADRADDGPHGASV